MFLDVIKEHPELLCFWIGGTFHQINALGFTRDHQVQSQPDGVSAYHGIPGSDVVLNRISITLVDSGNTLELCNGQDLIRGIPLI